MSFTANSGTKAEVLPKGRSSTTNSGTKVAVLLGINRCGSFPLLSAPHCLSIIWTDIKRSDKIPGAPAWRWGEWIWLIGPSGLHRNSSQGLNISSIRVFDPVYLNYCILADLARRWRDSISLSHVQYRFYRIFHCYINWFRGLLWHSEKISILSVHFTETYSE